MQPISAISTGSEQHRLAWSDALDAGDTHMLGGKSGARPKRYQALTEFDELDGSPFSGSYELIKLHPFLYVLLHDFEVISDINVFTKTDRWAGIHFRICGETETILGGDQSYARCADSFYFEMYPEGIEYDICYPKGLHLMSVAMVFKPELITEYFRLSKEDLPRLFRRHPRPGVPAYSTGGFPLGQRLRGALTDIFNCPYTGTLRTLYIRGKVDECVSYAFGSILSGDEMASHSVKLTDAEVERIQGLEQVILNDMVRAPHIPTLARDTGMNRNKLQYGFRRLFGQSILSYWHEQRMNDLRQAILETDQPIAEIAEAAGYQHHRSFSMAFKSYFGISPRQLRKK